MAPVSDVDATTTCPAAHASDDIARSATPKQNTIKDLQHVSGGLCRFGVIRRPRRQRGAPPASGYPEGIRVNTNRHYARVNLLPNNILKAIMNDATRMMVELAGMSKRNDKYRPLIPETRPKNEERMNDCFRLLAIMPAAIAGRSTKASTSSAPIIRIDTAIVRPSMKTIR